MSSTACKQDAPHGLPPSAGEVMLRPRSSPVFSPAAPSAPPEARQVCEEIRCWFLPLQITPDPSQGSLPPFSVLNFFLSDAPCQTQSGVPKAEASPQDSRHFLPPLPAPATPPELLPVPRFRPQTHLQNTEWYCPLLFSSPHSWHPCGPLIYTRYSYIHLSEKLFEESLSAALSLHSTIPRILPAQSWRSAWTASHQYAEALLLRHSLLQFLLWEPCLPHKKLHSPSLQQHLIHAAFFFHRKVPSTHDNFSPDAKNRSPHNSSYPA